MTVRFWPLAAVQAFRCRLTATDHIADIRILRRPLGSNAGVWLLPSATAAYREIGMPSEAAALDAAMSVIQKGENDYDDEATEVAYKSVPNEFADDEVKEQALLNFFRSDRSLFEFDGA